MFLRGVCGVSGVPGGDKRGRQAEGVEYEAKTVKVLTSWSFKCFDHFSWTRTRLDLDERRA